MKGYLFIIGILAIIVSSLITLNLTFRDALQLEMAEQFNKQQLLLANAEASNIQSYIANMKDHLMHIAHFASLLKAREKKDFLWVTEEVFKGPGTVETSLVFLDSHGDTLYSKWAGVPEHKRVRALFERAKGLCPQGSEIEHDPERAYIIAPVCPSGSFDGAVLLTVNIQDVAREFLSPIKSGERGYAWMMDDTGVLLYHPTQQGMVGRSLYRTDESCFKCHKSFEVEKKIIEGKDEYRGVYLAPSGEDKILAYSLAHIGRSRWIVAVSAPYSEVTMAIQRAMKFYSWLILAIFMTTSIVAGLLIAFHRKKVKAEEVLRHQSELEGYAENLEREVAKRTEELVSEKEKLNTIVTAIGSGITLIDMNGKVKWVNQAMKDLAGRDIVGMFSDDICTDCTIVGSYTQNEMRTEIMADLFGKKDRFFQLTTAPVKGDDGEVHGYIRLIHDVTEMKKMEEQMMHSEKLASLGRLTAGIAHEIGNPLTSVFSFVQILKEMEQDEFKKESLETIYFHISRIADILKQLSGLSKTPAVELRKWNVNSLIDSSLSLIQYDKRAKEIRVIRDLSPEVPEITTDGNQLSQVFINLILNAVDAMAQGGVLTIRSRVEDGTIVLDFEDTGVGIPRENVSRIFDPFFTTKEKGTGLGLAVSYSIVRKLNGGLSVESELNKGTRFRIRLPSNGVS